jgi:pimeloyl-ACP methyl ester carboxylesterase
MASSTHQRNIHYNVSGTGNITLLFIHGSFIDAAYWKSQVAYFSSFYKVVTMDLGGHGLSGKDRTDWTIASFAKDIEELMTHLEIHDVIMIAHSMGAAAMLEAAEIQPQIVKGLVAIDYFKNIGEALPQELRDQIMTNLQKDFPSTTEWYARTGLLTKDTPTFVAERVVKDFREADQVMGIASIKSMFANTQRETELLQNLSLRLYLLNCDYFPTNEEPLKKLTRKGYSLTLFPCSSHYPMIEKPDAFNNALESVIHLILQGG